MQLKAILRIIVLGSRWAMAPLCAGLAAAMLMIVVQFFRELAAMVVGFSDKGSLDVVLAVLKLVDLVLVGNLVLMIIGAAVEIYIPKLGGGEQAELEPTDIRDLGSLKLKVVAAISAIAAVYLLEGLLNVDTEDKGDLLWEVLILLAFVVSGVLLALMDWLSAHRQ